VWVWGGSVPALRVHTHLQRAAPEGFAHARREGGGGRTSPAHASRHVCPVAAPRTPRSRTQPPPTATTHSALSHQHTHSCVFCSCSHSTRGTARTKHGIECSSDRVSTQLAAVGAHSVGRHCAPHTVSTTALLRCSARVHTSHCIGRQHHTCTRAVRCAGGLVWLHGRLLRHVGCGNLPVRAGAHAAISRLALSSLRNTWHHMPHTSESVHLASKP
jgi:hypothetical protein